MYLFSPDLTLTVVCAERGETGGAGSTGGALLGRACWGCRFLPLFPAMGSAGAAPSCSMACPEQEDVLPPFLEAGLSGFQEEGKPSVRHTQGKREGARLV